MKTCRTCGESLPFSDFNKNRSKKDGLQSDCRACTKTYLHQHYQKNKQQYADYHRENAQKRSGYMKRYYAKNKSYFAEKAKEWRTANPERKAEIENRRRSRVANGGVFVITDKELDALYASACANCGSKDNMTVDHVIPISRGGRHSIGNLQPLCGRCNTSKNDRFMVEWKLRHRTAVA